jgi:adenosyl cobinamide kinase/adenosyl cobinamide phosphate guanylyltransferase
MKLTDKVPSSTHRVLIFGAPKSGKTQLAASLAAKYKLIWFDLENGYGTLLKLPKDQQERIELISIPDSKAFPIAVETMLKVITGNTVSICEEHGKVSCPLCKKDGKPEVTLTLKELQNDTVVVIDSLTQFTNSAIAHITKNQSDDYKMQFDDWGSLRAVVEKFLSQVQQARYNVVCISHEEEVDMEDGRKKIVPVCGSSKSSRNTAKYFDHVVYCEVKNKKHQAASSTTFANNVVTGSRTDFVMEQAVEPSLLDLFASHVTRAETPSQTALSQLKAQTATLSKGK